MNKAQILEKIRSNVLEITREVSVRQVSDKVRAFIYEVLVTVDGGAQLNQQEIFVLDEGLAGEIAYFANGREVTNLELAPPTREQRLLARLNELQTLGSVKGVDLSNLDIPFAKLEVGGNKIFVAELDKQLIVLDAA